MGQRNQGMEMPPALKLRRRGREDDESQRADRRKRTADCGRIGNFLLYLFCHVFRKTNGRIKIFEKYTSRAAVRRRAYKGAEPGNLI
jgi:hypothetical protein